MCVAECENCGMSNKEISYQIHITATPTNESPYDLNVFGMLNDIKIVNVLNLNVSGELFVDTFTSSNVKNNPFYHMKKIVDKLKKNNFKIIREKIETVPWNPEISEYEKVYYEKHWRISSSEIEIRTNDAMNISVSNNLLNKKMYVTYRRYYSYNPNLSIQANYDKFEKGAASAKETLCGLYPITIDKNVTEVCIYDSNIERDINHFGFRGY